MPIIGRCCSEPSVARTFVERDDATIEAGLSAPSAPRATGRLPLLAFRGSSRRPSSTASPTAAAAALLGRLLLRRLFLLCQHETPGYDVLDGSHTGYVPGWTPDDREWREDFDAWRRILVDNPPRPLEEPRPRRRFSGWRCGICDEGIGSSEALRCAFPDGKTYPAHLQCLKTVGEWSGWSTDPSARLSEPGSRGSVRTVSGGLPTLGRGHR